MFSGVWMCWWHHNINRNGIIILLLTGHLLNAGCWTPVHADKQTTCRLVSQLIVDDQRICVYLGANNTQYQEYVPYEAGACPREYQCKYRPNEKPFNLKNVIRSIKKQFRGN